MKKVLLGLALFGSIASADFIGASVGAGLWQENISGYVKSGDYTNYLNKEVSLTDTKNGNLGLSDEVKPYVWAKIIHPIPLIPNVKAEYRQYETSGSGKVVGHLEFFGSDIALAGTADTDVKIDSYDITLFYEVKLFVEVEAGIGVNLLEGETDIVINKVQEDSATWTVPIPYLYGRVETPTIMGFSAEAQGKYIDVDTAHYYDYQGAIKYHLPIPVVDITLSAGYKTQEIYGEDGDNKSLIKFDGAYLEVGARW